MIALAVAPLLGVHGAVAAAGAAPVPAGAAAPSAPARPALGGAAHGSNGTRGPPPQPHECIAPSRLMEAEPALRSAALLAICPACPRIKGSRRSEEPSFQEVLKYMPDSNKNAPYCRNVCYNSSTAAGRKAADAAVDHFLERNSIFTIISDKGPGGPWRLCGLRVQALFALYWGLDQQQFPGSPREPASAACGGAHVWRVPGLVGYGGFFLQTGQRLAWQLTQRQDAGLRPRPLKFRRPISCLGQKPPADDPSSPYWADVGTGHQYNGTPCKEYYQYAGLRPYWNRSTIAVKRSTGSQLYNTTWKKACPAGDWTCYLRAFDGCQQYKVKPEQNKLIYAGREGGGGAYIQPSSKPEVELWKQYAAAVGRLARRVWAPHPPPSPESGGMKVIHMVTELWLAGRERLWLRRAVRDRVDRIVGRDRCVALHVRRSDVATHKRFVYPLRTYIRVAGGAHVLEKYKHVILLTDDAQSVDEAQREFPSLKWVFPKRPVFNVTEHKKNMGYAPHLPSGDPRSEVLNIHIDLEMAARCDLLVYGRSSFSALLFARMCERRGLQGCGALTKAVCDGDCCRTGTVRGIAVQFQTGRQRCCQRDDRSVCATSQQIMPCEGNFVCHSASYKGSMRAPWKTRGWVYPSNWTQRNSTRLTPPPGNRTGSTQLRK
eukprot:TRINITY_DN26662_c0_g1_i2.p1 TRINITY_DN26662_c0_g1~~TRINITY_DN26662_c0_g1_i2.p1  ORF type:complete len:698 (+),score=140.13 TRINITY_DN26662_c0_g1_i2:119-2095(+)